MYRIIKDIELWLFGLKYSFFRRRYNSRHKEPLKLWYWRYGSENEAGNFGDEITKDIILKLFGYNSIWKPVNECEIIGAGSVIESTLNEASNNIINIWGSGFIIPGETYNTSNIKNIHFCAVRGHISRDRLGNPDIVTGDPGLLANIVYKRSSQRSEKIGVVVHYVDEDQLVVQRMKKDDRFIMIDPIDSPQNVVKKITECQLILSSSLHGLVFADSFGIPNAHIRLSDKVVGGNYKFRDYYSAIGITYHPADIEKLFDDDYLASLRKNYQPITGLCQIQRKLVRAFPYK